MILQHGPLTICSFFVVNTESSAMGQLIPMADIQRKVSMFPREVDLSVCLKVFYCQFFTMDARGLLALQTEIKLLQPRVFSPLNKTSKCLVSLSYIHSTIIGNY